MTVQVNSLSNGPLRIEGDFQILDSHGKAYSTVAGKPVHLCRCGHSANKPFCDGAHKKEGFASDVTAP